ncbi:MAG: response regulator transcription factor [Bacteroidetes bacterium]|nr:response regulator transcription factor [Bacteroidota bacterium]
MRPGRQINLRQLKLTRREKDIIQCLAEDMTTKEIAELLHLTENTVNTYRKNLLSKFGKKTSAGLVMAVNALGLLE